MPLFKQNYKLGPIQSDFYLQRLPVLLNNSTVPTLQYFSINQLIFAMCLSVI